jgi:hypothetical protein
MAESTANREVANRIRDVAKWLILILGAIGGVLLAGTQLSSIGKEGTDVSLAIGGIAVGLVGAGIALGFTVHVLLPVRVSLSHLASEEFAPAARDKEDRRPISLMGKLVTQDRGMLEGYASTITEFVAVRDDAIEEVAAARRSLQSEHDEESAKDQCEALKRAEAKRAAIAGASRGLVSHALIESVKGRMIAASWAVGIGALLVAAGVVMFSLATGSLPTGDVVPRRLSAVVVQLTSKGREELAHDLGGSCEIGRLRALALGGTPDEINVVSVPSGKCRAAHFSLAPNIGSIVNEDQPPTLRACAVRQPRFPCIAYPNSAALVVGKP